MSFFKGATWSKYKVGQEADASEPVLFLRATKHIGQGVPEIRHKGQERHYRYEIKRLKRTCPQGSTMKKPTEQQDRRHRLRYGSSHLPHQRSPGTNKDIAGAWDNCYPMPNRHGKGRKVQRKRSQGQRSNIRHVSHHVSGQEKENKP